jgi:uncharacterized surface protein with fasciclin (FAS1) repeats
MDIVDTALADQSCRDFISVLQSADLVDYLKSSGPVTVFVPTDEAFAMLPAGSLLEWEKPANREHLRRIVRAHILHGAHLAKEISTMMTLEAVDGQALRVHSDGHGITIENARLLTADIKCSNGIMHVVDAVLHAR